MKPSGQLFGKYRGTVVSNFDPESRGRIQVSLVDAGGMIPLSTYATPCLPFTGMNAGMFSIPVPGAGVWIEFEEGDLDRPVWVGGYWGSVAEVPKLALLTPQPLGSATLATSTGAGIHISDNPALGVMITNGQGAVILINSAGITITNGKGATIVMAGKTIDFNLAALTIT